MLCPYFFMTQLRRSLGLVDGLAMVVGIMVGSGIFRTPGVVAAYLGRPSLTFVAWLLGRVVALLGALCCAELSTRHPAAPTGIATLAALALAFQAVVWTYYGYLDVAKIAEEVVDPDRTLPRVLLGGIAIVTALYLVLNAAFFQVLPIERIAGSNLVPGDVAAAVSGAGGGALVAALALLVVVASLNGNLFVTPRVIFGMAREGLAPAVLARVNRGGTPWAATLLVGAVVVLLAATGTFQSLLGLAVTVIIVIDGFTVLSLFRLRARRPSAPFLVPLFPLAPLLFVGVYAALLVGTAWAARGTVLAALAVLGSAYGVSWMVSRPRAGRSARALARLRSHARSSAVPAPEPRVR